jgi:phage terminase large subunit
MISHVKRRGLPRSIGSKKGKGSVEDGIQFIRSFKRVVIHPRCKETVREFQLYSWKVDARSGEIRPDPVDANNHYIDALRYALEPIMRKSKVNWGAIA